MFQTPYRVRKQMKTKQNEINPFIGNGTEVKSGVEVKSVVSFFKLEDIAYVSSIKQGLIFFP